MASAPPAARVAELQAAAEAWRKGSHTPNLKLGVRRRLVVLTCMDSRCGGGARRRAEAAAAAAAAATAPPREASGRAGGAAAHARRSLPGPKAHSSQHLSISARV